MPEITIPVPDERVAEFYKFFGEWLAGEFESESSDDDSDGDRAYWTGDASESADAEWLWRKMSDRAKKMFTLLIDHPDKGYSGKQIATKVGIPNGPSGVAGVLAWPGRYCMKLNRELPLEWSYGENDGPLLYSMNDQVAALFAKARAKVDGVGQA